MTIKIRGDEIRFRKIFKAKKYLKNMETLNISKEKFSKILGDFENLINDVESALSEENVIVRKRINDIKLNPSIGKSEEELDNHLEKRGVKIDKVGNKRAS